jgi:hypothetical protein
MKYHSEERLSVSRYTIYDLMDATNLSRSALLNIINGRPNRKVAPLIPMREKKLVRSDHNQWLMTYSHRAYMKVIKWVAQHSRKQNE